jgi:hypothetical protein
MIATNALPRVLVLATALAVCTAPMAAARVPDVHGHDTATAGPPSATRAASQGVPPRVDGVGAQPRTRVTPVPVRVAQPHHGVFQWRSAAIAATAVLSVALLGLAFLNVPVRGRRQART